MKGKKVGYIRVSSEDQNIGRQLEGISLDRTFVEKASGKNMERPELEALMLYVREGDEVFIHSLDRLARNLTDLRRVIKFLTDEKCKVHFIKENLIFNGSETPMESLFLNVLGAIAEFERSLIRERQREGIELAKAKGIYVGGKRCLTPEQVIELKEKARMGCSKTKIAKHFGITRPTVYLYLKR